MNIYKARNIIYNNYHVIFLCSFTFLVAVSIGHMFFSPHGFMISFFIEIFIVLNQHLATEVGRLRR